jgi:hypothetical protein
MPSERKPSEGLLGGLHRQMLESMRPTAAEAIAEVFREQQRRIFHELLWGTDAPRQIPASVGAEAGKKQDDRPSPNDHCPASGAREASHRTRGRKVRVIADSDKMNKLAIEDMDRLIGEGKTDDEILVELGLEDNSNQKYRKKIRRRRLRLSS